MIKVDGKEISAFTFPGGERQIKLPELKVGRHKTITAFIYGSDDIMDLCLTVDALRVNDPQYVLQLVMPYYPYARQDRACAEGEAVGARVFSRILKELSFETITVVDIHSEAAEKYLARAACVSFWNTSQVVIFESFQERIVLKDVVIVAPDAGAKKKATAIADLFALNIIHCEKQRDPVTGKIIDMTIPSGLEKSFGKDARFLIVDDICDGGATFVSLANLFRRQGYSKYALSLYVTHGIFSKGLAELRFFYDRIYCYHAWPNIARNDTYFTVFT